MVAAFSTTRTSRLFWSAAAVSSLIMLTTFDTYPDESHSKWIQALCNPLKVCGLSLVMSMAAAMCL
jgi:hypothetical protein